MDQPKFAKDDTVTLKGRNGNWTVVRARAEIAGFRTYQVRQGNVYDVVAEGAMSKSA